MSNKLWLPPTKLLEPGNATRPLPVVRIKGVDTHSVVGQQLIQMFAGRISQFHMAQAQKYMLSSAAIQRGYLDQPDVRMRYTNTQGQEIIDVEVNPQLVERVAQTIPTSWDFVLVEVYVPDTYGGQVEAYGYLTTPLLDAILPDSVLPFAGVAHNDQATYDRMLNAPSRFNGHNTVISRAGGTEHVRSFLLDLRPARGMSMAVFDINAYFSPPVSSTPNKILVWGTGPGDGTGTSASPWPPERSSDANFGSHPSGVTQEEWDATIPANHFDTDQLRWVFDTAPMVEGPDGTLWTVFPSIFTPGWEIIWGIVTGTQPYVPEYSGPLPLPCEIQATLFKGEPTLAVADVTSSYTTTNYLRWDFAATTPARPGHMVLAQAGLAEFPTYDPALATLFHRFNMPYLGRVVVDIVHGGISFTAA